MMTPKRRRHSTGAILLVVIGIAVMLTGMALHWWKPDQYPLEWAVQLIGAAMAFAGFYRMDPDGAKDGGGFLVDAGTKIVGVISTGGRRSTDPPVVTPAAVVPAEPGVPAPDIPPTGGFPPPEQPHDVAPLAAIPAKERGDL
jgi:hypothetical protein